jgi:hypothetical protein
MVSHVVISHVVISYLGHHARTQTVSDHKGRQRPAFCDYFLWNDCAGDLVLTA